MAEHTIDNEKTGTPERHHIKHVVHEHVEHPRESGHAKEHHMHEASSPQHTGAPKGRSEIKISIPSGLNLSAVTTVAAVILLILVIYQAGQAHSLSSKLDAMKAQAMLASKAPVVQITAIEADCKDCTPITSLLAQVSTAKLNITKSQTLPSTDVHSQTLISQYGIKKLPSMVITGEIDKLQLSEAGFTKVSDALVYTNVAPPYLDLASGKVKGLVSITLVNVSTCKMCSDLMPVVQQLKTVVTVGNFKLVDSTSAEGQALVQKYSMTKLPGLLLSSDINEYATAAQIARTGTVKQDGTIALGANAPYINMSTGKVTGVTQVIFLNDSTCATCYDVNFHLFILKGNYRIYIDQIKFVDVNSAEGKALISKYKINAVPTFLLSGDVSSYDALRSIWSTVGTVESDGTYIFRTMTAIAGRPYRDLATGNIEPNAVPQQTQ